MPRPLPAELWVMILTHLDARSFLSYQYRNNHLTECLDKTGRFYEADISLKNASLVCWAWRATLWPVLFRHLYFRVSNWYLQADALFPGAGKFIQQYLRPLQRVTQTVTLFVAPGVEPIRRRGTRHYALLDTIAELQPHMIRVIGNSVSLGLFTPGTVDATLSCEKVSMLNIVPRWAPGLKDPASKDWWDSDIPVERLLSKATKSLIIISGAN